MANEQTEIRSMMRYLTDEKVFEYKADELAQESVKIPESRMKHLQANIGGSDPTMAKLLDFLVENAKKDPGKWVEATTTIVANGQALV